MSDLDLVIPIHNAPAHLAACLASLYRHLAVDAAEVRVHLYDDASTDAAIASLLETAPTTLPGRVRVIRNPRNLGFVGTVNRAFAETTGDVLLLNSDTVLTGGAIPRMRARMAADPRVASVTPFSNNAEICSFPAFLQQNPVPADPESEALRLAALTDAPAIELPTAVGFCMLIRRATLDQIGDFDAATFGRGYGEENDWCQRAIGFGWTHVLCPDAYVVHAGGASFGALGLKPGGENLARLLARYPHYGRDVAAFIAADPIAPLRARVLPG
ncbi:MAG: glycosyltransferase family 2 protein [Xanthomonadales bacterium]|jgi:GT2 family glycosyltransferase|nr:glycosyltransferase family 2 protein [Xanthomonadales bacterium]